MEKVQAIQIESLEDIKLHHRYLTIDDTATQVVMSDRKLAILCKILKGTY